MCGICGIIAPHRGEELAPLLTPMVETLAHRGPDGSGTWVRDGAAFGHTRLAVIDIAGGAQPMVNAARTHVISFNGEIYNYRELRRELEVAGETFATSSDTEVVLAAYTRWGTASFARLDGMFAFAIAGTGEGDDVVFARDRLGIKPLYFGHFPGGLAFGSEIKAVLASMLVDRTVDLDELYRYLAVGYWPARHHPFAAVTSLEPGSWAQWSHGEFRRLPYWVPPEPGTARATFDDLEEIRTLTRRAVLAQATTSDVPVGVFLSGGVDSGVIAACLSASGRNDLPAFTVRFPGATSAGDVRLASRLARRFDIDHHIVDVGAEEYLEHLDTLVDHFDVPFADPSLVPTYIVSAIARRHVTVALSGDGGDEIWGGYDIYRRHAQIAALTKLVAPFGSEPGKLARRAGAWAGGSPRRCAPGGSSRSLRTFATRVAFYASLAGMAPSEVHRRLESHMQPDEIARIVGDGNGNAQQDRAAATTGADRVDTTLDTVLLGDVRGSLVDDMLRKVDMMSMATGLEVRVPLLDNALVDKAMSISWRDKITRTRTKVIWRDAFTDILPSEYRTSTKVGFESAETLDAAFRGPLRAVVTGLPRSGLGEVLAPARIGEIVSQHLAGASHGKAIFSFIALQRWLDRYG